MAKVTIKIYYETKGGIKGILDRRFILTTSLSTKTEALAYAKDNIDSVAIEAHYNSEVKDVGLGDYRVLELVTETKGRWNHGVFVDHETDEEYISKMRKVTYSNGFVEYEVDTPNYGLEAWSNPDYSDYGDQFIKN